VAAPVKKHRWGPVVRFKDGRIMARCLNGFCDMDLSYDPRDVPEGQVASEIIRQMESRADQEAPCPFKVHVAYEQDRVTLG
jgi:hypothetical protein